MLPITGLVGARLAHASAAPPTPSGHQESDIVQLSPARNLRCGLPPTSAADRAKWVKTAFLEANSELAAANPDGLQLKINRMRTDPFYFFRGAATLFYLDLAKNSPAQKDEPVVRLNGDLHPDNFGSYVSEKGHLVYDINDFDEANGRGPFSWELRRAACGWILGASAAKHSEEHQQSVAAAFLEGFRDQMLHFEEHGGVDDFLVNRHYPTDGPVHDLLEHMEHQASADPNKFIKKVSESSPEGGRRFIESTDVHRAPKYRDAIVKHLASLGIHGVEDVAIKDDSGTASLGLPRFWALVNTDNGKVDGYRVIEIKQEIRSALQGVPGIDIEPSSSRSAVVAHASRTWPGQPYPHLGSFTCDPKELGAVPDPTHEQISFLVRERPALKGVVDVPSLASHDMRKVADIQGRLVAAAMARQGKDVVKQISSWLKANPDFTDKVTSDCMAVAKRMRADYQSFKDAFPQKKPK